MWFFQMYDRMAQLLTEISVDSSYWFSNAICLFGENSYSDERIGLNHHFEFQIEPPFRSARLHLAW